MSNNIKRDQALNKYFRGVLGTRLPRHFETFIAFDVTGIGNNTSVLMASVIYNKRLIPIVWITLPESKGHTIQDNHLLLLDLVHTLLPETASVVLVGDGEYDGTRFEERIAFF